jgi:tetratricopeptide (TPR) repeat protein
MNKSKFWLFLLASVVAMGCSNSDDGNPIDTPDLSKLKSELEGKVQNLSGAIFDQEMGFDKAKAEELLQVYITYTNQFHDDSKTCDYRVKAAELAQNLGKYQQAIELYKNVSEGCPTHDLAPQCAFMIAVVYHDYINDRETAKKYYEEFINRHPDHYMVPDAQSRIDMLYMTDEEIVRMFEEKIKNEAGS